MKNNSKGFTLIELLVVIAIIGILASVVLASLNSARIRGADAAVKGAMANMAAQAELYYDSTAGGNQYCSSGLCNCTVGSESGVFTDPIFISAVEQITKNATAAPTCVAASQTWGMSVPLKGGSTWCVDNNGWRKPGTVSVATGLCS